MDLTLHIINSLIDPINILFLCLGVLIGIIVGALPGLTATMALALLLPFTFTMQPETSLITMGGLYVGGIYGGCISAILINTPGTPSAIATTFDGYPLAQKGKASHALIMAAMSSGIGGIIGGFALLFLTPLLAKWALSFGPPEYFWVAVLGLTMIATLSSGSLLKGLIGGCIGLLLGTVGISPVGGESRFTFGFSSLQSGLDMVVILIAFFCIPEVISMIENSVKSQKAVKNEKGLLKKIFFYIVKKPFFIIRSSIIGIIVGIVPGAGGNVAALLSYDAAVRFSKDKQSFGKGNIDGVMAAETSNNAEVGGSLVPLLSLGIPGSPPAAIILGALLMQGIMPGPNLMKEQAGLVYTFLIGFIIANVIMLIFGLIGSKYVGKILAIPGYYLAPSIVFMTIIGTYTIRNSLLDIAMLIGFGVLAFFLKNIGFHPAPIVLGFILGPIAERGLAQSILLGHASGNIFALFFSRPISVVLIILCLISILGPLLSFIVKKTTSKPEPDPIPAKKASGGN
ncbi:C4-dicarboxylate ABC transporter permease [Siminovitchia acidinfaciens]|uniref:C4-dicarboxylate ABC transporter permease n=1 Tax=Siminovitchia acidinfaciens TaxID=2321395 RepID=A0A429Y4L1_9BACI|nr:tripartite tricarboxylate transporter permease [Siminovitchia acidinfaciens]RST76279.1 C4-dicarboxylate ABC transporter permease [Siminovitchia acidinfaciens]